MTLVPKQIGHITIDSTHSARCASILEASALNYGGLYSPDMPNVLTQIGGGILKMATRNGINKQQSLPFFVGLSLFKDTNISSKINVRIQAAEQMVQFVDTETGQSYDEVVKVVKQDSCYQLRSLRCSGCLNSLVEYSEKYLAEYEVNSIEELSKKMLNDFYSNQGLKGSNE